MSKKIEQTKCVAISNDIHATLVNHIVKIDGKIGKFVEKSIIEKIGKETNKTN